MKNFGAAILLLFGVLLAKEKAFVVVIPSYNNAQVYRKNLDSVFAQNYSQYRVIYIDDASSDGTGEKVKAYVQEKRQEKRVSIILNQTRLGALANKYKGAWLCDPKEIVVDLDGDDWFAHPNVLARLNEVYSDPEVWVTYGQFVYYPCKTPGWAAQVPDEIIAKNAFREYNWVTTALRTFYAGLFQKIRKEDLLFDGDFFPMAGDLAFMFPIVEMAGVHSRFISEALYVYNVSTGINDIVRNPEEQKRLGWVIRDRKKYTPVRSPY
jgi:glycosyltransferase involved in cell wall biosynthesis